MTHVRLKDISEGEYPDVPIDVDGDELEELIKRYSFVVIDCWAPWCGPCKTIAPIIEEMARDYKGKVVFGKLNTDENINIAQKYKIMAIPTLLYFKNGELVDMSVGVVPKSELKKIISQHV